MSVKVTKLETGTIFTFHKDSPFWAEAIRHPRTKEQRIIIGCNDHNSSCSIRMTVEEAGELFSAILDSFKEPDAKT